MNDPRLHGIMVYSETPYTILPRDTTDDQLIEMWLHGLAPQSRDAYMYDINQFRAFTLVPIQQTTLQHVQQFVSRLNMLGLKQNTVNRKVKAVKSLLSFARNTGYTPFNVGTLVKVRKAKDTLSGRILSKEDVFSIIALTTKPQYKLILRTLYGSAMRVSELCGLKWKSVIKNGELAQIDIYGKDDINRHVLLGEKLSKDLLTMKETADPDAYVFVSQKRCPFNPASIDKIIEAAAVRAGVETFPGIKICTKDGIRIETPVIKSRVSAHWLRHAHASHALEDGASIALVAETLGHQSIETTAGYTHARPKDSSAFYVNV